MKKAVFLDRDGVITKEFGYICPIDRIEIFPYARKCIDIIHQKGYLAIIITNQSGVARGLFSEEDLIQVNEQIKYETGVDAIFYCSHHVDALNVRYKVECNCRKPKIGMIEKAVEEYKIDLNKSFIVGDRATDIICGKNAEIRTVLVNSGYGVEKLEQDVNPDYIMNDLKEFAEWLK